MKILLVTSGNNKVRNLLEAWKFPDVTTFDLSTLLRPSKQDCIYAINTYITDEPYDLLITYRCPYILPIQLIQKFSRGGYNIHPSLLPKYAGLNPWIEIFKNKEQVGGVTLHRLDEEFDKGEIVRQSEFTISQTDDISSAREKADSIACDMLLEYISYLATDSKQYAISQTSNK